jgi:hypothetical protein
MASFLPADSLIFRSLHGRKLGHSGGFVTFALESDRRGNNIAWAGICLFDA